jgi:hypothetical protein
LKDLVKRYSVPPYNIKFWELGNEPDVDPSLVPPDSVFGCWGDQDDEEYYGGGYYAEMLKAAYPGGLLLDCDPDNPPAGKTCKASKFLEGILVNGGGNYFDIVNYHGYAFYSASAAETALYYDENHPGWAARGGVVLGKLDFIREVMAQYGVNKPVMLTEASLICDDCIPPPGNFLEAQADYVVWVFLRAWAADVFGVTWYTFEGPGWRNGGLLDANQQPRKAYLALEFMTGLLADTAYAGEVTQFAGVKGYKFVGGGKNIWALWSADGPAHSIQLPADVSKVYDKVGTDVTPSGSTLSVAGPVYVEFLP